MKHPALSIVLALSALAAVAAPAAAHEVRPGYLELREGEAGRWDLLFKVPARGLLRLGLRVEMPPSCRADGEPVARAAGGAHLERSVVRCDGDPEGQAVAIGGLPAMRTDVLVRVHYADGSVQTERLTPRAPSFELERAPGAWSVAGTYLVLGIEHILLGVDHLLFVLALLFLVRGTRRLIATITAFTLAHSVTIAASTLGWIHLPGAPVEATIALSIVFVASEIARGGESLARRTPALVALTFGLLHGMGFAGALRDIGLPEHAVPVALACFNIGVEIGQLLFVALVLGALALASRVGGPGRQPADVFAMSERIATPCAYAIGSIGAFWLIERTASFATG